MATNTKIITILSDDSRAHAYRDVKELLATENQLPTWSAAPGVHFFDEQGHTLAPRLGRHWQLEDLVRTGEPDAKAVLDRLHTVLDRTIDRVRQNPESAEDWGVTRDDAIAALEALRGLPLEDIFDQESALLDLPAEEPAEQSAAPGRGAHHHGDGSGGGDPGGWLHRILYHS